jgi:hypothetical protein
MEVTFSASCNEPMMATKKSTVEFEDNIYNVSECEDLNIGKVHESVLLWEGTRVGMPENMPARDGSILIDQSLVHMKPECKSVSAQVDDLSTSKDEDLKFLVEQCIKAVNLNEQLRIYLQNAIFSANQIGSLVNDLLDLAKMETSTFVLNNEYFNLIEVISQAFSIVQFQAEMRGISLELVLD